MSWRPTRSSRLLILHLCNQTHPHARSKLYQHVHIAVAPEIVAQYRPEEGQSPNVIPLTEFGDLHLRHVNLRSQCAPPRSTWLVMRASRIFVLVSVSTMVPSTIARRTGAGRRRAGGTGDVSGGGAVSVEAAALCTLARQGAIKSGQASFRAQSAQLPESRLRSGWDLWLSLIHI